MTDAPQPDEHRPWITNLVLLTLVTALGLWVWMGEGQTRPDSALRREQGKVFAFFVPDEVTAIDMGAGDDRMILAAQPGEPGSEPTWLVISPVEDRADDAAVRKLLSKLEWLEARARVEGDAGFGQVTGRAAIERRERPPVAFEIGEPRGGVVPLRRTDPGGAGEVVHVDAELAALLTSGPKAYRSKTLLTLPAKEASQLTVSPGGGRPAAVLTRAEGLWRAGAEGAGDFADAKAVQDALVVLEGAAAVTIAAEARSRAALEAAGLSAQGASITVRAGERAETLRLGGPVAQRPGARYALVDGRPVIYEVLAAPLEALLGRAPADWLAPELFPAPGGPAGVSGFGALFQDGAEVRLRTEGEDQVWIFQGEEQVRAALEPVKATIEALLALRIGARLPTPPDPAAVGLDEPYVRLELVQGTFRQEVAVGAPAGERPGVYTVQRLLPPPAPKGSVAVYTCELGALPEALEAAPLELLDRQLFRASSWDAREVTLTGPDGAVEFRAVKESPDPQDPGAPPAWRVDGEEGTSQQELEALLESFDAIHVERYVARTDGPDRDAVLARYGLDAPRLLTVAVEAWSDGALGREPRTLRLGRRAGERVFAAADGVPAVGSIHAGFLDRLARGFAPGVELFDLGSKWDVRGLRVERGGQVVFEARRPDLHWKRGNAILEEPTALEDVIEGFVERVVVRGAQPANAARLAAVGLDPPRERITFTTHRAGAGGEETVTEHVLLLGGPAGPRERWATTPGGEVLGRLFDAPLTGERGLDAYLREHPQRTAPFPPPGED